MSITWLKRQALKERIKREQASKRLLDLRIKRDVEIKNSNDREKE